MTNNQPTLTNTLQTIASNDQRHTNSRKMLMAILATLTAVTLIGQYVLLGVTGLGETRATLPGWFTQFELVLWGMRALVEIAVVVYIGMTATDNKRQERILWAFEFVLIAMIVITVGPIWASSALNTSIQEIMTYWGVVIWGGLLAGISATMLAGVSYAYKVQPTDHGYLVMPLDNYKEMLVTVGVAEKKRDAALVTVGEAEKKRDAALVERDRALMELEAMRKAVAFLQFLPASVMVRLIAMFSDNPPDAVSLAEAFSLSPSTVRGALAEARKINE
jgi:hypothetical protein